MRTRIGLAGLTVLAGLAAAPGAQATERWEGLRSLPAVALEITLSPTHPEITLEELRRRVEEGISKAQPAAPTFDQASADRLRLTVSVRSFTTSDLRGFYLPLSQTYGIGPVRLAVERPAAISGLPSPVWAIVWQSERQAKRPMRASYTEILELVDEVVAAFLADYRRAQQQ